MQIFDDVAALERATGTHLGFSEWHAVTQQQIDTFADATGDHQWIHVDPEAAARGPFGATIAHGFLTLSILPVLTEDIWRVASLTMGINYGFDRVRFPSVVKVEDRVRAGVELTSVKAVSAGAQVALSVTIEIDGAPKPACVADWVLLLAE